MILILNQYFNLLRLEFYFFVLIYKVLVLAAFKLLCLPISTFEFDNIQYDIMINGIIVVNLVNLKCNLLIFIIQFGILV